MYKHDVTFIDTSLHIDEKKKAKVRGTTREQSFNHAELGSDTIRKDGIITKQALEVG